MALFYVFIGSFIFTLIFYFIGKSHPSLLIFINLFVSVLTVLYLIFKDYGRYLIKVPSTV